MNWKPLVLVSLFLQPLAAQSNLALMANDHYTRSHDFDMLHQRIALSRFNWDSTSFEGVVTTRLVSKRAGLDAIVLDEGRLLINTSVTDRTGRALTTSRSGDSLIVRPARPLAFGDTITFTIAYHGKVKSGHGLTFITNDGLPHRPDQIWSQGEDSDNRYWFPTYDFPNDKLTWEMVVTVPKGNLAISNGRMVSNVVTGNDRTMSWHQDTPSASYLVSLIVAPLALIHDTWRGVPVDYYTYRADSAKAWPLFHVTVDMIETFSRLTGVKYPWPKYAQTTVADFFGGMENVSATTLVDWLPDARAYRDRPWYQYILIPHELAHQWFGDYVTTINWANTWLNEGFAEFMPGQYWREKLGVHAEEEYFVDEHHQYLQIESQRSMPLASMGSNNIYPKGALVLEMLKNYLGAERFWAAVRTYLTQHQFGNATSDDLRQAVLAATGENLDWFWNQWVYGAGHPQFVVTSLYDSTARKLTLSVKQTQVDSFKPDSTGRIFAVPPAFRMPINIRVGLAAGADVVQRVEINAREQVISIDGVTTAPTMVLFDDGNRMLKTLTFEQPVSWLARQLGRATGLWDRQWAIDQLVRHPGDAAAATALIAAATGADHPLTRAQAAEALGAFPPGMVMSAVVTASRDTAPKVRIAALSALEAFGGDTVARIARTMFRSDSSDETRAAALLVLAHTDPAHARDAIAAGLALPSYRDGIQGAALQAIVQLNDTSLVDAIDALIANFEYPAHALGVLGIRGNAHALSLMIGHLNDKRAGVRRYTIDAFRNTMARVDKVGTLQKLKLAVAGLAYPEIKQQVSELIATLEKP